MKLTTRYISIILLLLTIAECKTKDTAYADDELVDAKAVLGYEDGDTLVLKKMPPGLQEWLTFYKKVDTGFTLNNFKASGVSLHIGDLPAPIGKNNDAQFRDLFVYSPDSSRYLDLVSYNYIRDKNSLISGEADQQVVLADVKANKREQLFYFGPSQLAEFADWTGTNSFLVGIMSKTETGTGVEAELMFFHLKDSTYTNFRLNHTLPLDSILLANKGFLDYFFTNRQFNVQ
jgi:hypothetical protein